jgi:hypothetical protein
MTERQKKELDSLASAISDFFDVDRDELFMSREDRATQARHIFNFIANIKLGFRQRCIARYYNGNYKTVSRSVQSGKRLVSSSAMIKKKVARTMEQVAQVEAIE